MRLIIDLFAGGDGTSLCIEYVLDRSHEKDYRGSRAASTYTLTHTQN